MTGLQYFIRIPPGFVRDSTVQFMHGGVVWRKGSAWLKCSRGVWHTYASFGTPGPDFPGWSECTDTLNGIPVALITSFSQRMKQYNAYALPLYPPPVEGLHYRTVLSGHSPDSSEQRLFLTIIRTMSLDTTAVD